MFSYFDFQAAERYFGCLRFFQRSHAQVFQLYGAAGTGKTTILKTIAEQHPAARLCAFTGFVKTRYQREGGVARTIAASVSVLMFVMRNAPARG